MAETNFFIKETSQTMLFLIDVIFTSLYNEFNIDLIINSY